MIRTFVINAIQATERRKHIEQELSTFFSLDVEYVPAIMGKELSPEEIENSFDVEYYKERSRTSLSLGMIGCTLSHRLCYKKLLESEDNFALILEDDAIFSKDIQIILPILYNNIRNIVEPTVIILSPSYIYTTMTKHENYNLCNCFEATMTIGYLINKSAAYSILNGIIRPHYVADDWYYLRKKAGIAVKAVEPYLIYWDDVKLPSQINESNKEKVIRKLYVFIGKLVHINIKRFVVYRYLKLIGHHVWGIERRNA